MTRTIPPTLARTLRLGWVLDRPSPRQVTEALATAGDHDLYRTLRFNKVIMRSHVNLGGGDVSGVGTGGAAGAARRAIESISADARAQRDRSARTLGPTWARIRAHAARTGTTVALVKGGGLRLWYPDPAQRHLGDLDLWLPDQASAWALVRYLLGLDWAFNSGELPWLKQTHDGHGYGVSNLVSVSREQLGIDLHYGDYSVRHCGRVPLREQDVRDAGGERARIPDEELLVIMMANAAGDHFITLKDVNDLLLGATRPGIDWARVRQLLRQSGLVEFARTLATAAPGFYPGAGAAGEAISTAQRELVGRGGRLEPVSLARSSPPRVRTRTTVRHAWTVSKEFGLPHRIWSTLSAAYYYSANLRPRAVRIAGGPLPPWCYRPRPWRCVRLVPVDRVPGILGTGSRPSGAATAAPRVALGARRERLWEFAGGSFVPTVYGRLASRRLAGLFEPER